LIDEALNELQKAVRNYDNESGTYWAKKTIEEGIDPVKSLEVLTRTIREIGDGYSRGDYFLPDLIGGAEVVKSAMPFILEEFKRRGQKRKGKGIIVTGTVFGDIHSIGISMVSALAQADGFEVFDLGVNVKAEQFIHEIKKHNADILAMSALLTTTAPELKKVISNLQKEKLGKTVKVAVGGGAVTEDFAKTIGADGYAPTAPLGVNLFNKFIGK